GIDGAGQYGSEWLWRGPDASRNGQATWWARYDRFQQGFATFGGGNVRVSAGRDAVNVEAAAASNGYLKRDPVTGNPAGLQRQGGGDLSLTAGRDIAGGFVLGDAGTLRVRSGRDITAPVDVPGALQALHGDSKVDIEARNTAVVGLATSFGLISGAPQAFSGTVQTTLTGVASGASLRMVAAAGDLNYRGVATTDFAGVTANPHSDTTGVDKIIPDSAVFAAPGGSVNVGPVVQVSGVGTRLSILARQDATVSTVTVAGTDPRQATPTLIDSVTATALASTPFSAGATPLDQGGRDPVRIVAGDGDIASTDAMNIVKPIRLLAGRDVSVAQTITVQHQAADELSLIQAGRDVVFTGYSPDPTSFKVYGPGNLVTIAGRNIELNTSGGFGALGNRENAALPSGSATLTLLAGVALGRGDYAAASSWYFDLLGGTGIAAHGPDLAAQLIALQAGQALPGLGSSAATAFKSAPIADQITQTRALVGQAGLDAAVLADAQRRSAPGTAVDLATATSNFTALTDADKGKVLGAALANAWTRGVPLPQQRATVLAMVTAQGLVNTHAAALLSFVAAQTGQAGLDLPQSLAAFQGLAPERQLVFTNQVLLGEIRSAGRVASALSGTDRDAAYARAYDALAVVFPDAGTDGSLQMGSSQLRSYQNSAINVLTPRGGVNVGDLASSTTPKSASALGIVTGAGGDISMAVRDNVDVNQSRVFTVGKGDLLIWSSDGNIDAGRGAKTVTGAPPPVFRFVNGNFVIDTSGSYSGSGIAVLDASSTLDLYAPVGEINAGDAGIKSLGNAFLGAVRFVGADNLSVSGVSVGAPPPASTGGDTAGLANAGQAASTAATRINSDDSDEEKERKRRKRLNLILDFLGFGDGSGKP
ncbi:MAG: filamentous hemagglutinin family protein, partial [Bacteriovorax sp.]|nr:filamentous hemagglutinin family protein [Rhizobacter sp.]